MDDHEIKDLVNQLCFMMAKSAKAPVADYNLQADTVFVGMMLAVTREKLGIADEKALKLVKEKLPLLYELVKMKNRLATDNRDYHGLPEPTTEQVKDLIDRLLGSDGND